MKAVVYARYGPPEVLLVTQAEKPAPGDHEVLIRVRATTAAAADGSMRSGESLVGRLIVGLRGPRRKYRVLGLELAGEVEEVGKDVARFRRGDQVYGFTGFAPGAYAEYKCMPEDGSLAAKPANLTYEEAAAVVDGATTALFFLRDKARLQRGQRVLINGASGSTGAMAVQLAKHFGANVTGVCSTDNLELVRSLGADQVIDYTREDFTMRGETYDVIFDVASRSSFARCRGSLEPGGCYLVTVHGWGPVLQTLWTRLVGGKRVIFGWSVDKTEALTFLKGLIEAGKLRPVIDRRFPLDHIADAHRYVEAGHKRGSVVITV